MITFRATPEICRSIENIMSSRLIDRTSVMALALYALEVFLNQEEFKDRNLHEIVAYLEQLAPEEMPKFGQYSWGDPSTKKRRSVRH